MSREVGNTQHLLNNRNKIERIVEVNCLPYMQILGSSNAPANKDNDVKIWTNGDTTI